MRQFLFRLILRDELGARFRRVSGRLEHAFSECAVPPNKSLERTREG
jgi:hypothetical protein